MALSTYETGNLVALAEAIARGDRTRAEVVAALKRAAYVAPQTRARADRGVDITSPTRRTLLDALSVAARHYHAERAGYVLTAVVNGLFAAGIVGVAVVLWWQLRTLPGVVPFWVWLALLVRAVGLCATALVRVATLGRAYAALVEFILVAASSGFEKSN